MNKQTLKEVILDQRKLNVPESVVLREIFADLARLRNSKQVLILSGIRRCGKSVLLGLCRKDSPEQDYYINFDDDRLVNFKVEDFQTLYELFVEMYGPQNTFYFDEIQNIKNWERFIRRLHEQGKKIYITGSNASMLSAELGTRLTGRNIEIHLYPYSFNEYLTMKGKTNVKIGSLSTVEKGIIKSIFNQFLEEGGLPEYIHCKLPEYLHSLYQNILYRDIIVRHNIKNHQALKELVYYLATNISKECSFNSLKKMLGLSSATTVSDYCGYLEDSFLCFFINRYEYSLKKQIQSPKKVYFIDQALAVSVGFQFSSDMGRLLENIVFLELKRRGHSIYYHQGKKECDFVLKKERKIIAAIQVCVALDDAKTRDREIFGLIDAMQEYQLNFGVIVTSDTFSEEIVSHADQAYKIRIVPIWAWLLESSV
ncbi:MAG: ATP-binding protein [Gammaproteobacteria bacterium]|nr:ATP-binding protein [Gammaproteobacteria bacterium]